ncbi:Cytochrome regulator dap1 [Smittium mucronatum]|uniref:Cytochrome regulator dap1 n=1 Tax=Smittium mucronatum TaxID=133383 RepID=A0A1R0H8G2_9FUNG|nr:Cytochrome regulator dap1 [Smittium mucronatum]
MYEFLTQVFTNNSILEKLTAPTGLILSLITVVVSYLIFRESTPDEGDIEEPEHPEMLVLSDYTLEQLKAFDGSGPTKLIFIGICGKVYDVSEKTQFYGPEGPYASFAGSDATMSLAKNSTTREYIPKDGDEAPDLSILSDKEREALDGWISFFDKKYQVVGKIVY